MSGVKSGLKSFAYACGLLAWWHRRRNANALTVFMFHRVLPRDGAAYQHAEREFTFSVEGFGRCLDFIQRHYSVVTIAELEAAIEGRAKLPACPALITFDDGWRDTLVYAYPELKARNLSALVFLATEILDTQSSQWWQATLVRILEQPAQAVSLLQRLGLPEQYAHARSRSENHEIAGCVAAMPLEARVQLLSEVSGTPLDEGHMMTSEEVATADRNHLDFGAHGHTHAPLTVVAQPAEELRRSRSLIDVFHPAVSTMSFPHGAYNGHILEQAHAAGFRLVFTSDPTLLDMQSAKAQKIGRIHIPENEWTSDAGKISFPKLATFLFFRPKAA